MSEDVVIIVVDPLVFELKKLIDRLEKCFASLSQTLRDAMNGIEDLAERIKGIFEECQAEEQQNKPEYGPFVSSCSCLVFLRIDLIPWYTSGFQ